MNVKSKAFAYLRVSGRGQVEGNGFDRQLATIRQYAKSSSTEIINVYRDAHTGTEAERPSFQQMLLDILGNGVRIVIVESLDRFARELMVQIRMLAEFKSRGITLISASTGQNVTAEISDDPMREAMVNIQGVFAELDKKLLVRKLAKARHAIREKTGRCEGRKPYGAKPGESELVERVLSLRRGKRNQSRLSFELIAAQLNAEGVPTRQGRPWQPKSVYQIVKMNRPQLAGRE